MNRRNTGYAVIDTSDRIISPIYATYEQACGHLNRCPIGMGYVANAIYEGHVVNSPHYYEAP